MIMKNKLLQFLMLVGILLSQTAFASFVSIIVPMNFVALKGHGKSVGFITMSQQSCGVLITPNMHDLAPGLHGFHIHEIPSCDNNGMAAGGHLDPHETKSHAGPYRTDGHLGDLPILIVNEKGFANLPIFAPKLRLSELRGHAVMVHEGSDNYSDQPEKLGGGGARMICGIVQ